MFKLTVLHYFLIKKRNKQKGLERESSCMTTFSFLFGYGISFNLSPSPLVLYSWWRSQEVNLYMPSFPSFLSSLFSFIILWIWSCTVEPLQSKMTYGPITYCHVTLECFQSQLETINEPIKLSPTHWSCSSIFILFI